jgi:quercetin dioxygenase-like cupin family protein
MQDILKDINSGVTHHFSDGLYAKEMNFPAGAVVVKHVHDFNHLSILAKGKVEVLLEDGDKRTFTAPTCIEIKAGVYHGVTALTDCTWFCIHATNEKDPHKVDNILIKEGA